MRSKTKSIFELERKIDFSIEYTNLLADIVETMLPVFDRIKTWPYRQNAKDPETYANNLGFSILHPQTDEERILSLELFLNLLHWVPNYKKEIQSPLEQALSDVSMPDYDCKRLIENVEWILDRVNMQVRISGENMLPKYVVCKRDADVDAVLESVPELSESLLSYLDIRNRNDEARKMAILNSIAGYLEPYRKKYKGTGYAGLCEDLFVVFNKCNIRHTKEQWKLQKSERIKLYDQSFKAAIHLIQSESVKEFRNTVNILKQRFEDSKPESGME